MCIIIRHWNLFLFYFFFVSNKKSRVYLTCDQALFRRLCLLSRRRSQPCREGNRELTSCIKDTLLPDACGTVKRGGEVNEKEGGMERENGLFPFVLFSNSPFAHLP